MKWALFLLLGLAHARHTDREQIIENSTATVRASEFQVGLLEASYGLTDRVQVGTFLLPWALGLIPQVPVAPNLNAKWRFYQGESWSFGARLGVLYVDLSSFSEEPAKLVAVPFEAITTWRAGNWAISGAIEAVRVQVDGSLQFSEDSELEGLGVGSTVMGEITVEWRRSETFAWVLELRALAVQQLAAQGATNEYELDERTVVEVFGEANVEERPDRSEIGLSAAWSWDSFNLKAGLGAGHLRVPFVNFFAEQRVISPKLDLFWRF